MSTYYDLVCVHHGEKAGFHWNHGADQLEAFAATLPAWAQMDAKTVHECSYGVHWSAESGPHLGELIDFAKRHSGCVVKPKDEYGRWYDKCGQKIRCGECGHLKTVCWTRVMIHRAAARLESKWEFHRKLRVTRRTKMKQEPGTIISVMYGPEDHGILTCLVTVDFDGAGAQGFGGLSLGEQGDRYVAEICRTFGVAKLDDLIGKRCVALYCFPNLQARIEGLEAESGARFTHEEWRRKQYPEATLLDPLDEEIAGLNANIESLRQRLRRAQSALETVRDRYTPLSDIPKWTWR